LVEQLGGAARWSSQVEQPGGAARWSSQVEQPGGAARWSSQVERSSRWMWRQEVSNTPSLRDAEVRFVTERGELAVAMGTDQITHHRGDDSNCVCVCMCMCMYVCMYVCICVCTH